MGNIVYSDKLSCYESSDYCARACSAPAHCIYMDRCGDSINAHYACLPFDTRFLTSVLVTFMWILVGIFIIVVLCCSALVVFYALRVIRRSFRNPIQTDGDIIFYNARNVHNFPHPATMKYTDVVDHHEYNSRRNGYY